ncbi:beta-class carbonic anhydrase [Clostridium massiliamazoniense]|uniref:beta-class carbonic anhydrase n=1 Tax=Clostridium massiliamazoniense TaxID=1347366 RepID=UPI0006D85F4C|nr:carbonic anhydrase [Clostridium massiliamazoniense]
MEKKLILDEILDFNKEFVENKEYENYKASKLPEKKVVVVSCMDTRLTELLPKAMNIKNGDAKMIKNAGGTIVHPFGSAIRSILVAVYAFDAEDIIIVGHHNCGMSNLNTEDLTDKMKERGISEEVFATLENSGIDIKRWLQGFESVEKAIKGSVNVVRKHPLMPKEVRVHGLVIDPETGKLDVVVRGI